MLATGAAVTDIQGNVVPILSAIGGVLLGLGGFAAVLTARANRQNYVTGGFRDLTDASAKEAADERALRQRAEYMRDAWREAYYGVRDEAVAKGITLMTRPPTEHPSEGSP
jgi:hypothetical protein